MAAPQPYQLVMRRGPTPGKTFDLDRGELTIGRDIHNDIVINDAEVSRHHARLVAQGGGYVLEDMGSTNGTFVNGQRLMGPHMLRLGEEISLGENVGLSYEMRGYDAGATQVAASNVQSMPPVSRPAIPPEPVPTPVQPVIPPYEAPTYPEPAYSGQAEIYPEVEEPRASRNWLYLGCGCLVILLCVLVGAAVIFDQLNLYCTPTFSQFFPCP